MFVIAVKSIKITTKEAQRKLYLNTEKKKLDSRVQFCHLKVLRTEKEIGVL